MLGGVRDDDATAGASDEREVEELDMELVVNHGRMAWMRHAQVMLYYREELRASEHRPNAKA